MKRLGTIRWIMLAAPVLALCLILGADEKDSPGDEPSARPVIRIYYIADLVQRSRDFSYAATAFPAPDMDDEIIIHTGGFGPGEERTSRQEIIDELNQEMIDQLMGTIQRLIAPESWKGAAASLEEVEGALIVRQTPVNHQQIEALLAQLREELPSWISITIQAQWVTWTTEQFIDATKGTDGTTVILPKHAAKPDHTRYSAQITCRNGQILHVASGTMQTELASFDPLVADGVASFSPRRSSYLLGAVLEVRPTLLADQNEVSLDLHSFVTEPLRVDHRAVSPLATAGPAVNPTNLDLPRLLLHNLAATVRVPLNQPVLVGAMTASTEAGPSEEVLCLILTVTARSGKLQRH